MTRQHTSQVIHNITEIIDQLDDISDVINDDYPMLADEVQRAIMKLNKVQRNLEDRL